MSNETAFLVHFLPVVRRTVSRSGFQIDRAQYQQSLGGSLKVWYHSDSGTPEAEPDVVAIAAWLVGEKGSLTPVPASHDPYLEPGGYDRTEIVLTPLQRCLCAGPRPVAGPKNRSTARSVGVRSGDMDAGGAELGLD